MNAFSSPLYPDCTAPFAVDVFTDAQNDNVGATNSAQSRGILNTMFFATHPP